MKAFSFREETAWKMDQEEVMEAEDSPSKSQKAFPKRGSTNKVFQKMVNEELQKEDTDFDKIAQYMEFDVDLLYVDEYQSSVLHRAASVKNSQIAAIALRQKADINAVNTMGRTPLHYAAEMDSPECLKLFLQGKADTNISLARRNDGTTFSGGCWYVGSFLFSINLWLYPKYIQVRAQAIDVVKVLLEQEGIDLEVENNERKTALMLSTNATVTHMIENRIDENNMKK